MMVLQTERLISRKLRMDDAQAIFDAYATDPLVARFMTWRVHRDVTETESFLATVLPLMEQGERQTLALFETTQPDRLVGLLRHASMRIAWMWVTYSAADTGGAG